LISLVSLSRREPWDLSAAKDMCVSPYLTY
jgi:hypothetical protein